MREILKHLKFECLRVLGPFPTTDPKCGMMIAQAIPKGYCVIARPLVGMPPFTMTKDQIRPLPSAIKPIHESTKEKDPDLTAIKNPKMMLWNQDHLEGKLVPLRQPAPPVFFNNNQK